MDSLKTIPKKNARRRGVMKGAAVGAGVVGAYSAPMIQKIAVSVAHAASPVGGSCFKFSLGGQFTANGTLSGGLTASATKKYVLTVMSDTATLTGASTDTQLSGIIFCCTGNCAIPNGDNLQIGWQEEGQNGQNVFHLTSVTSVSCNISNPNSPQVPLPSPNTLNLSATGTYNLAQGGGTGTATLVGTFVDNGEIGGVNNDATSITITLDNGTVISIQGSTLQTGNYTVLPFNCNPV
jgi:hypothetical protein